MSASSLLARLQPLGRSLMLPIAVLPIAGLLLRLGQPDLLGIPFVAAAGNAIFANLGLLFAIGVSVGFARENHGAAGLAGAVGYLVATEGAKVLLAVPPEVTAAIADEAVARTVAAAWSAREIAKLSVPAGILSGIAAGMLYNRYSAIKLPEYLAFFGGRRFVPIAAGFVGLAFAALLGFGFPWLEAGIDTASRSVVGLGPLGLFLFGVLNRLLIVTGLHHILNNVAWFILGDFNGATGDLNRFFAGDPKAGSFMAGFFPVMMFGLPAACLAMYRAARPERRTQVAGIFISLGLTSFLTGITEPIEFVFMFVAPLLFAVHAVMTGLAMVLMDWAGVKLGFGFSAGLLDYVLNYGLATRPLLMLPIGLAYAVLYYVTFAWCIRRFDLKTPGRDTVTQRASTSLAEAEPRGSAFLSALGGPANLRRLDACTTRLRIEAVDPHAIDEALLKALGARGVLRPGGDALQVVLGPIADLVASEIRSALAQTKAQEPRRDRARVLLASLGADNVESVTACGNRLALRWRGGSVDTEPLRDIGIRAVAQPSRQALHLLLDSDARELALDVERLLVR